MQSGCPLCAVTGALADKTVVAGDEEEEELPRVKPRLRVEYGEP